jgi:FAD/FMN-containing dehydrogenase
MIDHVALRRAVRGQVLVPGDAGFEAARLPWNRAVEQRVRAVVEIEDAADAAAVVTYAGSAGLGVAVQPSGHSATHSLDGQILVRTGRMRGVEIRPQERLARVEPGASWGEVLTAAAKHGLVALAGSSPVVSATGFTLGGGLSWFGRAHGLAANSVRALDVVDATGARARVSADSDPELFWALRGGGGDFALVTAMEIDLYPAPNLYGGRRLWPISHAEEVLSAFREITADAPDELSAWFTLLQFPPFEELPPPLRGLAAVTVDVAFLGEPATGQELTRPLERIAGSVLDTRGPLPVDELGPISAAPTEPMPAAFGGQLLTEFGEEAAATLLSAAGRESVAPLVSVQVRHLGGAFSRAASTAGACGHIAEPYLLGLIGVPATPELAAEVRARQAAVMEAMAPYASGRKPFTFLGEEETAAAAFPEDTLARLRDVKRRRDPRGVFRSNYPVLV